MTLPRYGNEDKMYKQQTQMFRLQINELKATELPVDFYRQTLPSFLLRNNVNFQEMGRSKTKTTPTKIKALSRTKKKTELDELYRRRQSLSTCSRLFFLSHHHLFCFSCLFFPPDPDWLSIISQLRER